MLLRMATLQDLDIIIENNIKLAMEFENIEDCPLKIEKQIVKKGVKRVLENENLGFYFICKEKEALIGQVLITYEWSDWRNQMIWWLHRIYVTPKWRKKGALKKIIKKLDELAEKKNVYAMRLYLHSNNKNAIYAYEKTGWEKLPFKIYTHKKKYKD